MSAIDKSQIDGAKSCLNLIRGNALFRPVASHTFSEDRARRDAAVAALVESIGELSPRAAGAVSLLAELVATEMADGGLEYLDRWQAEATMTPLAIAKHRAKEEKEYWPNGGHEAGESIAEDYPKRDTEDIFLDLQKAESLIIGSRHTAKSENTYEGDVVSRLLFEAESLVSQIKLQFEPREAS